MTSGPPKHCLSRARRPFGRATAFAFAFTASAVLGVFAYAQSDRDLGKEAVALVEDVSDAPKAGVEMMDYVYPQQRVSLGAKGKLVLSYLNGCMTETITGGTVTISLKGSQVAGGKADRKEENCPKEVAVASTSEAGEAGATANRFRLFGSLNWSEQVVKSNRPTFKWIPVAGNTHIEIYELDHENPVKIWEATTPNSFIPYPQNAKAIQTGMPYRVQIKVSSGAYLSTDFSVDPGLDLPDTLANRVVPIQP